MRVLVIDNYDSFVYNIAQRLGELKTEPTVIRNDKVTVNSVKIMDPDAIVISPGPGHPADRRYFCLGHQGIVHAFGGKVVNARKVRHGKTSIIQYNSGRLFDQVSNPFKATRYHSLVADKKIPPCLEVTATALDDGEIMAIRHRQYLIEGVQFHPESILTEQGPKILLNFISMVKR
jgi:anthranilate synthase component 2